MLYVIIRIVFILFCALAYAFVTMPILSIIANVSFEYHCVSFNSTRSHVERLFAETAYPLSQIFVPRIKTNIHFADSPDSIVFPVSSFRKWITVLLRGLSSFYLLFPVFFFLLIALEDGATWSYTFGGVMLLYHIPMSLFAWHYGAKLKSYRENSSYG